MVREISEKKSKLWLWIVIAAVVVAVIVAGIVFLPGLLGAGNETPELYWNVDREQYTNWDTGHTTRQPAEDGMYYIRFAHDGEQIELSVADKKLVESIDAMDIMALTLDKDGVIVGVKSAKDVASILGERMCIQEIAGDSLTVNSSIAMSGRKVTLKITDRLHIYNMSGKGAFIGQQMQLQELQIMDTVNIYGVLSSDADEIVATHIFLTEQWEVGKLYWRADRYYDSKAKGTTREPDENGIYTIPFYCDGETVELKFKDKAVVDLVDYETTANCYFGFEFDGEGYAVEIVRAFKATHTVLQCDRFDIVELNEDGSYVAADMLGGTNQKAEGVIGEDCAIYDISAVAKAEGALNRKLDGLRLHDRVYIWTDTVGNPVLIYVTARRPDSPAYYNPDPQYDTMAKQTTRTPNADGYYEIELLKAGETELQTYYVKDVKLVNTIDKASDLCVGLKLSEGNIVEYVYGADSVFGNSYFCRGYTVKEASSAVVIATTKMGKSAKNGVLAKDCKIWNVSDTGTFGEETTLRTGDTIYAIEAPSGEIINVYVLQRAHGKDAKK